MNFLEVPPQRNTNRSGMHPPNRSLSPISLKVTHERWPWARLLQLCCKHVRPGTHQTAPKAHTRSQAHHARMLSAHNTARPRACIYAHAPAQPTRMCERHHRTRPNGTCSHLLISLTSKSVSLPQEERNERRIEIQTVHRCAVNVGAVRSKPLAHDTSAQIPMHRFMHMPMHTSMHMSMYISMYTCFCSHIDKHVYS